MTPFAYDEDQKFKGNPKDLRVKNCSVIGQMTSAWRNGTKLKASFFSYVRAWDRVKAIANVCVGLTGDAVQNFKLHYQCTSVGFGILMKVRLN